MKTKPAIVILLSILLGISAVILPISARNNNPNRDFGNPAYVLNILAKKDDWNPNGDFSNPDRHTIFVHEQGDVNIWMTQAPRKSEFPFAVIDGNGCDGDAALQLGDGYFAVFVVALGRPGGTGTLGGLVTLPTGESAFYLGGVDANALKPHRKTPVWEEYTNLFYITHPQMVQYFTDLGLPDPEGLADEVQAYFESQPGANFIPDDPLTFEVNEFAIWIFDFFDYLIEIFPLLHPGLEPLNGEYSWDLKNKGIKHLQVRFYYIKARDWPIA
jgi:hypothetical protein